jgi:hypothetical protein
MAVTHKYIGTDGVITVDFTDQVVRCDAGYSTLEIQELVNACREAEYSETGMAFPKICNASGKEYLDIDNGVQVGITIVLLDGWVIYSEKGSGVFRVLGGNLVQVSGGNPFLENSALTYVNILSASSTVVAVTTGSGLSTEERSHLLAIPTETLTSEEHQEVFRKKIIVDNQLII